MMHTGKAGLRDGNLIFFYYETRSKLPKQDALYPPRIANTKEQTLL